jgi:hypothetical protein
MAKDCNTWSRHCIPCQTAKTHTHIKPPPQQIPIPHRRFSHIHIDIVGPLPSSQGHTHILTMIDRTTRWPEAAPLTSTTAADCASALITTWITRFGVPDTITSDRGTQFTSSIWSQISHLLNIQHITTTAYHPQSNGMIERFHRSLKATLRARCTTPDWTAHLPWFLLSYRATPHDISNTSPAEAVFGSPLILPAQFAAAPDDDQSLFLSKLQSSLAGHLTAPSKPPPPPATIPDTLLTTKFVFVRSPPSHPPLAPAYRGPYLILRRSPLAFLLQLGDRQDMVSVHRLKPANVPENTQPVPPPPRGRPAAKPPKPPSILRTTPTAPHNRRVRFRNDPAAAAPTRPPSTRTHRLPDRFQISSLAENLAATYL